jgi:uncharacterized protein GlcG (DUF336 family)
MKTIDLKTANRLIETCFKLARSHGHLPITCAVVDSGGHAVSIQREDGSSTFRVEIALGKAWTCMALHHSTRFVEVSMTKNRPHFVDSLAAASNGKFIPALGGVMIRDPESNELIGAIGITGDTGENDELVALEAIAECGLKADLS